MDKGRRKSDMCLDPDLYPHIKIEIKEIKAQRCFSRTETTKVLTSTSGIPSSKVKTEQSSNKSKGSKVS